LKANILKKGSQKTGIH